MKFNSKIKGGIKYALLAGTFISGFAFTAPVFAQEASNETVVVTGTRIKRPNLTSTVAISSFSSERIAATGQQNIADVIRLLPSSGISTLSATNSNFLTAGAGVNTIELRNLGESRTLVLVNGRRFVSGSPGTQAVDLNSIPTDFIERVDVVTGGASAVYGSDALAGVVNIITKRNYEGMEIFGQYGQSFEFNDDVKEKISLTAGTNFAEDRGNVVFNVTWDKAEGVAAKDRPTTDGDYSWTFPSSGSLSGFAGPAYSSFIPQGNIKIPTDTDGGIENRVIQDDGTITSFVSSRDGFSRNAQRLLLVPNERILAAVQANYEVNRYAELFGEFTYAQTKTASTFEAVPYSSEDVYEDNLPVCGDVDFDGIDDARCAYGVPLTNPLIPTALKNEVRGLFPTYTDEQLVVGFYRRLNEIANRGNDATRETFRAVLGSKGDFGASGFKYEISANYGRTSDDQTSSGDVDNVKFGLALDAIDDGSGHVVCRDPAARAAGCVPINIFGRGKISQEAANYVGIDTYRNQVAEQFVVNGFLTGDLFSLPAGPVNFVVGAEYRKEKSEDVPDPLSQTGGASGNATPATYGEFDVKEIFFESTLPLLKDMPLAQELTFNLALRLSDYSTVGKTSAYAASFEYQPTDWIRFRTQYARAVRAPNVSELYQPLSEDFPDVTDACAGVTKNSGGQAAFKSIRGGDGTTDPQDVLDSAIDATTIGSHAAVNCLADPAVLARVNRNGALALTQAEAQGVSGLDGGSTKLDAETSDSYTFGFILRPKFADWVRGLSISFDYYDIKIKNVIETLDEQLSVNQCYTAASVYNPNSVFCSNIVRFENGPQLGALRYVNQQSQNLASIESEGFDVQADYGFQVADLPFFNEASDFGKINLSLAYSYTNKLTTVPYEGATKDQYSVDAGTIGASKNEWLLSTTYRYKKLTINWETQFIGRAYVTNDVNGGDSYGTTIGSKFIRAKVDPQLFHNIQIKYDVTPHATFTFGIDNLFDEYVLFGGTQVPPGPTPPLVDKPTGWSTFPDVYDGLRRRGYIGIKYKF